MLHGHSQQCRFIGKSDSQSTLLGQRQTLQRIQARHQKTEGLCQQTLSNLHKQMCSNESTRVQNSKFSLSSFLLSCTNMMPSFHLTSRAAKALKRISGSVQKTFTNIDGASNEPKLERRRKTESLHKHCFQHIKHWHCIDLSQQPPPICKFLKL